MKTENKSSIKKEILLLAAALGTALKVKAWVAIACGIIVLAGGVLVVVEMSNYCKKHGLDGSTSSPPPTIPTNSPPGTNSMHARIVDASAGQPTLRVSDDFILYTDISGYYAARDTGGLPFTTMLKFRVSTGPTAAGPWTTYCVTGWGSANNLLLCFYSNGVPVKTNYGGLKNAGAVLLVPTNAASQFFKLEAP